MSYTPVNTYTFLSAFEGALAGIGVSFRPITSQNQSDYTDQAAAALAFAEQFDTSWGETAPDAYEVPAIGLACEGYWANRPAVSTAPSDYTDDCLAIIAAIREGETALIGIGVTPPAFGVGGATGNTGPTGPTGASEGTSLNRQSSINTDPDSGQFVAYQQSYIPQGTYTLVIGGITVSPSDIADDIFFEIIREGATFGAPDATRTNASILGAELTFIDSTRPTDTLTNYGIRATNLTTGHTVSVAANQAYLNFVDFL